jgi:fibronectin type 3 domain-containing protein
LIVGANLVATQTNGPGEHFTSRIITSPDGNIAEDRMVTATGSYGATAPVASGSWIMHMVAFRTPVSGGDTTPPTVPTNLIATAASASQMNLNWTASTDNVGVTAYLVERCQGAGCTNFAQISTSPGNSYSDQGLTANTSYSYRIRATDAAGNVSPYSNVATANTQATQPTQATVLSITPSSANFGNVPLGGSSSQSVVVSNASVNNIAISQASVAGREFSISGLSLPLTLAAGQNSTFSVAFTPSGAGTVTGSVSIVSNATNSPTTEALSGTGIHNVVLSWQPSTSIVAGYNVYRGTVSGGPYTKLDSSLVGATNYRDTTVQAGQTYYYVATAVDSNNNESTHSTEVSAVVPSP